MAQRRRSGGKKQPEHQAAGLSARVTAAFPNAVIWALLFARWLLPAEGSAQGETLWLTSLTLFAAALLCWAKTRSEPTGNDASGQRLTRLDWTVLLLCGSHIFASLLVLLNGGNRRATLNLGWEWTALAFLFLLLRQSCRSSLRPVLVRAVTAIWIALAAFGLWQHAIWYPATLKAYEQARSRYDAALSDAASERSSSTTQQQLRKAAAALTGDGVPLSGPARELFERRLRDSQEPLGFFALANSFAGCLSVVVVLLTTLLIQALAESGNRKAEPNNPADPVRAGPASTTRRHRQIRLLAIVLPLLLTAACLILTKSRTAWCGTLAGLIVAGALFLLRNRSATALRRGAIIAAGLLIVTGSLAGTATLTGGLDPNVVREAPKSLKYRLEYWTGTLAVISEHPVFGVGPGQFRDQYLRHKLPESSEEIADPHQAVLDVWANAGLPALLGLIGLIGFAGRNILSGSLQTEEVGTHPDAATRNPTAADQITGLLAIGFAAAIVLAAHFALEARIDGHVLAVGVIAVICWRLLKPLFDRAPAASADQTPALADRTLHVGLSCGLVALLVHLLGAGGIAMPAIVGLLLLLALLTEQLQASASKTQPPTPRLSRETLWTAGSVAAAILSVTCSLTGFVPDQSRRSLLAAGDFEAAQGRAVPQAERLYHKAAAADALSPDPWLRLSDVAFRQWNTTGSDADFNHGLDAVEEALRRSPHTATYAHHIGHWLLARAKRESNPNLARQSVEWLDRAVAGYPTEPQWLADLALALQLADDISRATTTATQTLDLDAINRKAGHIDRYLSDDLVRRLNAIATGQPQNLDN